MFSSVAAVEPSLPRRGILQNTVTSAFLSQVLQNVLLLFFKIIFSLQIDIGDLSKPRHSHKCSSKSGFAKCTIHLFQKMRFYFQLFQRMMIHLIRCNKLRSPRGKESKAGSRGEQKEDQ